MTSRSDHLSLFKAWLEDHRGIIVKVTRSFAPAAADAADLQLELLLQLWISLSSFEGQANCVVKSPSSGRNRNPHE